MPSYRHRAVAFLATLSTASALAVLVDDEGWDRLEPLRGARRLQA